jgi:hypothetical protein
MLERKKRLLETAKSPPPNPNRFKEIKPSQLTRNWATVGFFDACPTYESIRAPEPLSAQPEENRNGSGRFWIWFIPLFLLLILCLLSSLLCSVHLFSLRALISEQSWQTFTSPCLAGLAWLRNRKKEKEEEPKPMQIATASVMVLPSSSLVSHQNLIATSEGARSLLEALHD